MHNAQLTFALLLAPFLGAVLAFVFGKLYKALAFWTVYLISFGLFVITLLLFWHYTEPLSFKIEWFTFGDITLPFGIYIDRLSLVMLLIANGLGFLTLHFSHDYMKEEPDQTRYYSQMLFFIGGMILLVSAKELLGLFVGWELMGLASYLLISFWHTKTAPADAGVSAFLYTKFGDIFLFVSIGLLFYFTGTLDMQTLNHLATEGKIDATLLYSVAIFIFLAALGKSGQFPFFPWLMRAMEGPTTVSALIHGAAMVNAGIYIIARLFDFYVASGALIVVASVAALSTFIGASSALVQSEMKKVLAYSTMSHLSLAFIGLGAGSLAAGMTHLVNHAIFKALLFLSAGAVILLTQHTKSLWPLGGLGKKLTLIALFMGMGVLSLGGVPPFSGFFSKDAIITATLTNPETFGLISTLTLVAGLLSIAYGGRLWVLIFSGKPRDEALYEKVEKPSLFWITLPLGVMALLTLGLGFFQDQLALFITGKPFSELHLTWLLPLMMSIIAIFALLVYFFYYAKVDLRDKVAAQPLMKTIHQILFNGYYVETMISWLTNNFVLGGVAKTVGWIEKNIIDAAINSTVTMSHTLFKIFGHTHSAKVSNQTGSIIAGLVFVLGIILFRSILL